MDSLAEERLIVWPQAGTPIPVTVQPRTTYVVELEQTRRGRPPERAPDPAISATDIRYHPERDLLSARIHNVGSTAVKDLEVVFYEGNPDEGGREIGRSTVPNLEPPNELQPQPVTVGINWTFQKGRRQVYVVLDPQNQIENEITTFNNRAHAEVEWRKPLRSWAEI